MQENLKALKPIPEAYFIPDTNRGGTVVRLDYKTLDYAADKRELQKHCLVYLPYGYDSKKKYNTLYLVHGGGGEMEVFLEGEDKNSQIKKLFDAMIANGDMEPVIVVTPTYYHMGYKNITMDYSVRQIEHFHMELLNDLIPAVEGKYSTYAQTTDLQGLKESRTHRAYGGYSMGSLSTWYTFLNCHEYFHDFIPMSGDLWVEGKNDAKGAAEKLETLYKESGYSEHDFLIYAVTGDEDIAYMNMKNQMEAMGRYAPSYKFITEEKKEGNIYFNVEPGAVHDYKYMPLYFYNALPLFWKNQ